MPNITPKSVSRIVSTGKDLRAKLYPNNEAVIYRPKTIRLKKQPEAPSAAQKRAGVIAFLGRLVVLDAILRQCVLLGLSILTNFDKVGKGEEFASSLSSEDVKVYGMRGITSYGRRRVRNACYLLESGTSKHRLVFATVTVPDLPFEQMEILHKNWHHAVEAYRRKLTRALKQQNLSGESVTVSEVQEKRYERTGSPVLHLHTVFVGKTSAGRWAITPEHHDNMWRESLCIVLGKVDIVLKSACNIQRVRDSSERYLGKYMSKGLAMVDKLRESKFNGWLPKQWWNVTRSLGARVDDQTRDISGFAEWLDDVTDSEASDVWVWHREVLLELDSGALYMVARYGRLKKIHAESIRDWLHPHPT